MDNVNVFCKNLLTDYPVNIFPSIISRNTDPNNGVGSVMAALGVLYLFMSLLIVYFIRLDLRLFYIYDDDAHFSFRFNSIMPEKKIYKFNPKREKKMRNWLQLILQRQLVSYFHSL